MGVLVFFSCLVTAIIVGAIIWRTLDLSNNEHVHSSASVVVLSILAVCLIGATIVFVFVPIYVLATALPTEMFLLFAGLSAIIAGTATWAVSTKGDVSPPVLSVVFAAVFLAVLSILGIIVLIFFGIALIAAKKYS